MMPSISTLISIAILLALHLCWLPSNWVLPSHLFYNFSCHSNSLIVHFIFPVQSLSPPFYISCIVGLSTRDSAVQFHSTVHSELYTGVFIFNSTSVPFTVFTVCNLLSHTYHTMFLTKLHSTICGDSSKRNDHIHSGHSINTCNQMVKYDDIWI